MEPSAPATPPEAKPESCSPAMSMALLKLDMSKSMYAMIVPALIFMPVLIRLASLLRKLKKVFGNDRLASVISKNLGKNNNPPA